MCSRTLFVHSFKDLRGNFMALMHIAQFVSNPQFVNFRNMATWSNKSLDHTSRQTSMTIGVEKITRQTLRIIFNINLNYNKYIKNNYKTKLLIHA